MRAQVFFSGRRGPRAVRLGRIGLTGVAEGFLDAATSDGVLAVDALGVDLEQDGDAVPRPLGDLGGAMPPLSQVKTQACRRS